MIFKKWLRGGGGGGGEKLTLNQKKKILAPPPPNFFFFFACVRIFFYMKILTLSIKCWACVGSFLALVWKFFIVHEENIIYLSNDTNIFGLRSISGVCLEISRMCMEFWIVHKDCAIFYPMTQKIPDCSKFPACVHIFTACVWKFPDLYKFLKYVWKFPACGCVRKFWSYKNIIFVYYHMTKWISR